MRSWTMAWTIVAFLKLWQIDLMRLVDAFRIFSHFSESDDENDEKELKYGAQHVIHLFVPVSICMAFVILTMNTVGYYSRKDGQYLYDNIYIFLLIFQEKTVEFAVILFAGITNP